MVSNNTLVRLPFSVDELDADTMQPRRKHYNGNKTKIVGRKRRAKLNKLYNNGEMFRSDK